MFHHVAVASKDVKKSHKFYTEAMGFKLKKIVKRQSPEGGWTKHIFYDTGDGGLFAIWDLRGIEGVVIEAGTWQVMIGTHRVPPVAAGDPRWRWALIAATALVLGLIPFLVVPALRR